MGETDFWWERFDHFLNDERSSPLMENSPLQMVILGSNLVKLCA